MADNVIRVPRKGPMNIGTAWAIFTQLDNEDITLADKIEAINLVVNAPTHNSMSKDKILAAFRWVIDTFEFPTEEEARHAD